MPLAQNGMIVGNDRGGHPNNWNHVVTRPPITMAYHHTIPWLCLRGAWNNLVLIQDWGAVDQYLQLISAENCPKIIAEIKANNLQNRDILHTQLTWQGWNIVEGPETPFRNDDPGENFEVWSDKGLSNQQKNTQLQIKILYQAMRNAAEANTADIEGRKNIAKLGKTLKSVKSYLRGKDYIA